MTYTNFEYKFKYYYVKKLLKRVILLYSSRIAFYKR